MRHLLLALTLVAEMAATAHASPLTSAAQARGLAAIQHAPTASGNSGVPVPALAGGVVLAFAVGIGAGQVHRRRRRARGQSVAREWPAPVRTVPEPPLGADPPLRLVPRAATPRPAADAPLAEAPEVPRLEAAPPGPVEPAPPLDEAPEALGVHPTTERPAAPARPAAPVAEWPSDANRLWTCEIDWKPGYRTSTFRAVAGPPGSGKPRAIGDSAPVRWTFMSDPEPPTPELAIRVRGLVEALEAAGWKHIGRGRRWYAQRFVWRGQGEPPPIDVRGIAEPPER